MWSQRLFEALFLGEDLSEPVTHVPSTAFDLHRVAVDPGADPDDVAHAFVQALKRPPSEVREELSKRSLAFGLSWVERDEITAPSYFAYLVLTCYAAAGGEDETLSVGDFARRFRLLLGHDVSGGYPYFDGLSDLWEWFERWVSHRATQGRCRPFVLPPKDGYRTRIGYSYALAFPTFRERRVLAEAFEDLQGEEPGMREAIRRVRAHRASFDEGSQLVEAFDDFAERYSKGTPGLLSHPFWTAVRDATSLDYASTTRKRVRLGLIMPDPGALVSERSVRLVAAVPSGLSLPPSVALHPVDGGVGGFESSVHVDGPHTAASRLLADGVPLRWQAAATTPLASSVKQGVLLFARDERGWPVTRHSLPDPGQTIWLLAKENVVGKVLLRAFRRRAPEDRPSHQCSLYPGWRWAGPFDARHFHDLGGHFDDIRCLHRRLRGQPCASSVASASGPTTSATPPCGPSSCHPRPRRSAGWRPRRAQRTP